MLSSVLSDTFSSVGHVFSVKIKITWRDSRLRIMLSYVHCIQLFSEDKIIYTCILKQTNIMLCGFADRKKKTNRCWQYLIN